MFQNPQIREVLLGSGKNSLCIGKDNDPVISRDVFDYPIPLPGPVRKHFKQVMENPVEWAKFREKNGAQAITLHLVSTDPSINDTDLKESVSLVADVLDEISVPLIVGGSGNPGKDPVLLSEIAEAFAGENLVLSTIDPEMDFKSVAKAAIEFDHSLMSLIPMNPYEMRRFNRVLLEQGVPENKIIMDLFTGGIGYGIEYSISAMQQCRQYAAQGDKDLAYPIAAATSNAWSAREAWMREDSWGPREKRGPLWESGTAACALLSGADLMMMLEPTAIDYTRKLIKELSGDSK